MTTEGTTPMTVSGTFRPTYSLGRDDLTYIVDALLDAADARRARPSSLNQTIADHLDNLAVALHDTHTERLELR